MQQALRMIAEFFHTCQAPQEVKNAWAQVKINHITSDTSSPPPASTTPAASIVAILESIRGMLTLIGKCIPVAQDAAKPFPYTDAAHPPPPAPQAPAEKFLPSRVLRKVTVQPLAEPEPMQASEHIVEAINTARASLPGQVVAARCLRSGDVLVAADSHSTKNNLEGETRRTTVIAKRAKVKGKAFTVMALAVRTSMVDPAEQAKSISDLEPQNPGGEGKVKICVLSGI
jgi:hypothetical protein